MIFSEKSAQGQVSRYGRKGLDRLSRRIAELAKELGVEGTMLAGRPVSPTWDANLGVAMREQGVKVEEERVVGDLLADLDRSPGARA
jgi:hypothetical protein